MPALANGSPLILRPQLLHPRVSNDVYLDAVKAFLRGHATPAVLRQLLNCNDHVLPEILASEEWAWMCDAYRTEMQRSELALMTRSINKALQQCIVRLEEGDPVLVRKKGSDVAEIVYAPVKAKDAAAIAAVLMDRRDRLERKLGGESPSDPLEDLERLANIATKLKALHIAPPSTPGNVIDLTPRIDALELDERDGE